MRLIDADALQIEGVDLEKETPIVDFALSVIKALQNAHTIDPEELRPKGEWTQAENDVCYWYVCSECGGRPAHTFRYDFFSPYCPHCGAKMGRFDN